MVNKLHQRQDSVSNVHVGSSFEVVAQNYFASQGIVLTVKYPLEIGVGKIKKKHNFDLGSSSPFVIVECKSYRWTAGNKVPSAKLSLWNEAMLYFITAPVKYCKILFGLRDYSETRKETLLDYSLRTYRHLIPNGIEFLEFDEVSGAVDSKH